MNAIRTLALTLTLMTLPLAAQDNRRGLSSDGDPPPPPPQHGDFRPPHHEGNFPPPPHHDDFGRMGSQGFFPELPGRPGMRMMRAMARLHMGVRKIMHESESLNADKARIEEMKASGSASEAQIERLAERIALRENLLKLDKEDFLSRVQEATDKALEEIEAAEQEMGAPDGPATIIVNRVKDRVQAINTASDDFDQLAVVLLSPPRGFEQREDRRGGYGAPGSRRLRELEREAEALSRRLEQLQQEIRRIRSYQGEETETTGGYGSMEGMPRDHPPNQLRETGPSRRKSFDRHHERIEDILDQRRESINSPE